MQAFPVPRSVSGQFVRVSIQTWRDFGRGSTPFDAEWRAHGVFFAGAGVGGCGEEVGSVGMREGVRAMFERDGGRGAGAGQGEGGSSSEREGEGNALEQLAYSWVLDRQKQELKEQEDEWRAIWKYIERRAVQEARG